MNNSIKYSGIKGYELKELTYMSGTNDKNRPMARQINTKCQN